MRYLLAVFLLSTVVVGTIAPTTDANAGVVSVVCWNANNGPLPAPMPTIGCSMTTIPAAGGGTEAYMESKWSCTPDCFSSTPVTTIGPFNANVSGTVVDQLEFNCVDEGITGTVIGRGRTVEFTQSNVIVREWSSGSAVGSVGFYCPVGINQLVGFTEPEPQLERPDVSIVQVDCAPANVFVASWQPIGGANSYTVQRRFNSSGSWGTIATASSTNKQFSKPSSADVYIRVKATGNSAIDSEWSLVRRAVVECGLPIIPPGDPDPPTDPPSWQQLPRLPGSDTDWDGSEG